MRYGASFCVSHVFDIYLFPFPLIYLGVFRRIPAHYSQEASVHALGTRWRVRKLEMHEKKLARHGQTEPITGHINFPPTPPIELEEGKPNIYGI